jgi:RNA polymerase sigma-70 factor, ECF subfamily
MAVEKPVDAEVDWIRRAQRGEREAFERLVERYQRRVFALAGRLVRRRDDVEDLAQEIFVKAYVGIRSYDFRASFGTWLARVAVNHCYDYLRRERVSPVATFSEISEEGAPPSVLDLAQPGSSGSATERQMIARDLVQKLLSRAPEADRVILTLKEIEDLSVEEVGRILKLKESTVKVRLHRARKRMLEDFQRWQRGA